MSLCGGPGRRKETPGLRPYPAGDCSTCSPPSPAQSTNNSSGTSRTAIWFRFSRSGCDAAVDECLRSSLRLTDAGDVDRIRSIAEKHTATVPPADLDTLGFTDWLDGLERGFAAHHAGMALVFRHAVEELFGLGLLRVVFATETLAVGVNMPARTVVLERLVKPTAGGPERLTPGEYTELTGRAGRRGIDTEGHAVVLWTPEVQPALVAGLASTRTNTARLREIDTELSAAEGFPEYLALRDRLVAARGSAPSDTVTVLARAVRSHPAHRRGDRDRLLALASRRRALGDDTDAMRTRIATVTGRLTGTFDGVLALLDERGHVVVDPHGGHAHVTEDGRRLARIYCANDLLVAECLRSGVWTGLGPAELAAVASSVLGESRQRVPARSGSATAAVDEALRATGRMWAELAGAEQRLGLPVSPEPDPVAVVAIHRPARGDGLAAAMRAVDSDISAGDLLRRYLRTLDLVGQTGLCDRGALPVPGACAGETGSPDLS